MADWARPVPLAKYVSGLRKELHAAHAEREPGLQFAVGPVAAEFTVLTARCGTGYEGGLLGGGGGGSARWLREAMRGVPDVDPGRRIRPAAYLRSRCRPAAVAAPA